VIVKWREGEALPGDYQLSVARSSAAVAAAIGAVVLAVWLLAGEPIAFMTDAAYGMSTNAAVALLFCGLGMVAWLSSAPGLKRLSGYLALIPFLLAFAQILDFSSASGPGVGSFVTRLFVGPARLAEFRTSMAPGTTAAVLAISLTQIYIGLVRRLPDTLALMAGGLIASGLGFAALLGHAFGAEILYKWHDFPAMSLYVALGIWLLGFSMLMQARHPALQQTARLHFAVSALLSLTGLVFDLVTPPTIGSNIIFIPAILTAVWFADRRVAFSLAIVCGLFSFLAFMAKVEDQVDFYQRLIGRSLGIGTLFVVAALIYFYKLADQRTEEGRYAFDTLMHNSPDAVVTIDGHGQIQGFNPAARGMFGYTEDDVLGQNVKMLMPEPDHSAHDTYLDHYAQTGEKRIIGTIREVSGRRSDGTAFPLDLSISVLSTGRDKRFVGILRDLSSRKKQEDTLRQALNRLGAYASDLERSNQELDEFAYIASHDLKEPLRGLHNHSRFLLEDYENVLDSEGKRRLNRLVFLSQRMEKLVNDLLYFSRIGRQELAFQPTDINDIIRDILGTSEQFLEERHAKVRIEGTLPVITCDAVRITEVFRNLIVNAVKYNDKPEKTVEIGWLETAVDDAGKDATGIFYVRDNGKGIAPEFYQDIFRIFKRLEKSESDTDGTGVGLTFVRKIIARHGGTIWLTSEPGIGTTFFFTLATEQR
jgi:PAS domain S-box-containing protein